MASVSSINNLTSPATYSKSMTPAMPSIRKLVTLEPETASNKLVSSEKLKIDDRVNKPAAVEDAAFVEVTAEEQTKFEAAQQKAQRAEFDLQTNNLSSTQTRKSPIFTEGIVPPEVLQKENPAITLFNQLQNIEETPRQGQEVDYLV